MANNYKEKVKEGLYRNYFMKFHEVERQLDITSNVLTNRDIVAIFKKSKKKYILDAGCGEGLFMSEVLKAGLKCEGMDINSDLLRECTRKGFTVKKGDFQQKLPYANNTFDGIYCSNVLEHLSEPEFALYELIRILKKDGLLIISVPETDEMLFYNDWTHKMHFTKQTVHNLMKCFDVKEYAVRRRHFRILVRYWNNPSIKFLNWILSKGPIAAIFTWMVEKFTFIHRHDLVIEIRK